MVRKTLSKTIVVRVKTIKIGEMSSALIKDNWGFIANKQVMCGRGGWGLCMENY